ncbi:alpha-amylase family glycosyl hydrolase [Actibacterium sp. 188UL27-1]|uniref:alpha-amylase family glycosyl hydrolase n=1 Tax=Actibacterium sp. 188UL27-1 TaxID=2786961 RepID=UPI00195AE62B|nr:alpha-amylase family glycosyl hydrolase [Actibacterium sp. 188UL27-1]MBM7069165.1 alpha-glucosidase C-terminal domain-containing protein [Actibacterium sp. 188UL27-1]
MQFTKMIATCATLGSASLVVADQHGKPALHDWNQEVLYFVIPDRFADGLPNAHETDPSKPGYFHGGDWKGLTNQLPYLDELGVTALWITPIVDNIDGYVEGAGFPDWAYHGYWADNFTALDPRMGSEADLKALVDQAHALNMKVLVDVVFNHVGYGSDFIDIHPDWIRQNDDCGTDDLTTCLFGLPDLKTERPDATRHVLNAHAAWVDRIGFDGYRIDTAKHVEPAVLAQNQSLVVDRFGPHFLTLGEVWGADASALSKRYFEPGLMTGGIDFSFRGAVGDWLLGRSRTVAFAQGYLQKRHKHTPGAVLAHYLSGHDEPGLLHELNGDKTLFKLAAGLQMTSVGMPIIYYGEEVARDIGEWPSNRSDMPWGLADILPGAGQPQDLEMLDYYKRLIAIRHASPALSMGAFQALSDDGDLLIFARSQDEETVIIAVNRGVEDASAAIPVDHDAEWVEQLGNHLFRATGGVLPLTVPAQSIWILKPKP